MPHSPPLQQQLPLDPQPASPHEVDHLVLRWLQGSHFWRHQGSPAQLLADPQRAERLRKCARQALLARQRAKR